ncbi:MAG: hypothetical protein V3S41_01160 [Spirochaetia bacterium]
MHQSRDLQRSCRGIRRVARVTTLVLLLFLPAALFGANVSITVFQLLTRGILEGGQFSLETAALVEIAFGGGYKFGGQLSLSLDETNLEQTTVLGATYDPNEIEALLSRSLRFQSASVVVRDTFGLPIDVTYFIGEVDRMLNGDVFPARFGSDIIASQFRGLLYFPTGVVYDGVHAVNGTGIAISSVALSRPVFLQAAIYQDAYLGAGLYSVDLRAAFNAPGFKAETFLGASFPAGAYGIYRGGLLLFYNTGQGGEFLTQIGIPRWAPVTDGTLNIDDFFFLFEPRVHIGFMSIVLTLFWHPEYYLQEATNERGATDIIVRFIAGNVQENVFSGGLENGITLRPESTDEQLRVSVTPFVSVNASGVIWDLKVNVKVFPFALDNLLDAYIGIRTEF